MHVKINVQLNTKKGVALVGIKLIYAAEAVSSHPQQALQQGVRSSFFVLATVVGVCVCSGGAVLVAALACCCDEIFNHRP